MPQGSSYGLQFYGIAAAGTLFQRKGQLSLVTDIVPMIMCLTSTHDEGGVALAMQSPSDNDICVGCVVKSDKVSGDQKDYMPIACYLARSSISCSIICNRMGNWY